MNCRASSEPVDSIGQVNVQVLADSYEELRMLVMVLSRTLLSCQAESIAMVTNCSVSGLGLAIFHSSVQVIFRIRRYTWGIRCVRALWCGVPWCSLVTSCSLVFLHALGAPWCFFLLPGPTRDCSLVIVSAWPDKRCPRSESGDRAEVWPKLLYHRGHWVHT